MTTTTTNFLGIKVEGEITQTSRTRYEQKPAEELSPVIGQLFADPEFQGARWEQYTPYFNDGDPCVFNIHEVEFRYADVDDDEGEREDGWVYASDVQVEGGEEEKYAGYDSATHRSRYEKTGRVFQRRSSADAANDLAAMIPSGHYEDALLEAFGDHAQITLTRDGFDVTFYEHD